MKTKIFLFIAIALLLLIGGLGCEKEIMNNVPYGVCPCSENEQLASLSFPKGEAYLFNDSLPIQRETQLLVDAYEGGTSIWFVFNSKTNSANLYIAIGSILNICKICNYPDFAKEWNITKNGQKVYFEGITYQTCNPSGGIGTVSYFDYILTTLIKK